MEYHKRGLFFMALWNMFLQWLYPPHCLFCQDLLKIGREAVLCSDCHNVFSYNDGAVCQKCGCNLYVSQIYCDRCEKADFVFEKGIAAFSYDKVRDGIAHFKLKGWKRDAKPFAHMMGDYLLTCYPEMAQKSDLIMPVPIHDKKQKKRGFNQSELLAVELAERIQKRCSAKNLKRIRETIPQSSLSVKERKENIKNAFALENPHEIQQKTILLIDDIFTTGTTINECARVLYENGAKAVFSFCLSVVEQ